MRPRGIAFPSSDLGSPPAITLPADLLRQAASRLGLASLIYAATYAAAFYPTDVVLWYRGDAQLVPGGVEQVAAATAILASIVVFFLTRSVSWDPATLLDLGLLYEVVAGFGIAVAEFWNVDFFAQVPISEAGGKPWFGISWVCVWILAFPVIVPNTPGKALLASVASASMPPFTILLSLAFGATDAVPAVVWVGLLIACYSSAFIAFIASRTIYGLGRDVREAREMGSYRLVEKLGEGGMGEVWRAEHRMLARPAAIKIIRRESIGSEEPGRGAMRRFEREAQATAMLRSPHTVELYDFGLTEDGRFYYVMELLDGFDLDTFVKRFGALPAGRAVQWLIQACDSLAEAHERGLVHRDIKPANLYVCRLGTTVDFIKVLDFGLVKRSLGAEDATRLTVEGIAAGTPGYMAPEMAQGISRVDHRVDIYALGCVGYWLLTGALVFEADSPMKMIVDHVQTTPLAPSQRTELPIPASLDEIILDCLAKDPAARPENAALLAERLAACPFDESWSASRARPWWDLHLPARF